MNNESQLKLGYTRLAHPAEPLGEVWNEHFYFLNFYFLFSKL